MADGGVGPLETATRRRSPVLRAVVFAILIGGVAANVIQHDATNDLMHGTYPALVAHSTSDIVAVGAEKSSTVRDRWSLYFALRDAAPDAHLSAPPGSGIRPAAVLGLARLESFTEDSAVSRLVTGVDVELVSEHIVTEGEDRHVGPYAVAVGDSEPRQLVALPLRGRLMLIDRALFDGTSR